MVIGMFSGLFGRNWLFLFCFFDFCFLGLRITTPVPIVFKRHAFSGVIIRTCSFFSFFVFWEYDYGVRNF